MRPGVLQLALLAMGCSDWTSLSRNYEGDGVCAIFSVAGDTFSCMRNTNASLYCWGDNRFGQLGTGDHENHPEPTRIRVGGQGVTRIYLPEGEGDVTRDVAVFTCAITTDSSLWCWGDNRYGQLGTGDLAPRPSPTMVDEAPLMMAVTKAANGAGHVCALTAMNELYCWGRNQAGQLGLGDTMPRSKPTLLSTPSFTVDKLMAGGDFTCVKAMDKSLWCWGDNQFGQLGLGNNAPVPSPMQIPAVGNNVLSVANGGSHSCALMTDSTVWCWGDNSFGQLGLGDTIPRSNPTQIDPTMLSNVTSISAGGHHSCATKQDNTLWCWGDNRMGQLGIGDTNPRPTPKQVSPTVLANSVANAYAGGAHTCAVLTNGAIYCWGANQYGQLGVQGPSNSTMPVRTLPPCM
jgi:alpha-tubulin suppressor-like RCC1 family protein